MGIQPNHTGNLRTYSGLWWALQSAGLGTPHVHYFFTQRQRDLFVSVNPINRRALGKRNPAVKAFRRRVTGRTNV